jgi:hypothetical protein
VLFKEAQHGGGFAAGQDETVEAGKLVGLADFDGICAGFGKRLSVRRIVALDGEDSDAGV